MDKAIASQQTLSLLLYKIFLEITNHIHINNIDLISTRLAEIIMINIKKAIRLKRIAKVRGVGENSPTNQIMFGLPYS